MSTKLHPNICVPSKSNFTGFSLPDGAWLPPELIYLLPNISGSELKVLVAMLYNYMQIGGGEPTSLTDLEHMTGLSRPTVTATLDHLLARQVLERQAQGQSFIYLPVVKFYNRSEPQLVKNFNHLQPDSEESERELINY